MRAITNKVLIALPPPITETEGKILLVDAENQRNWYGRVFAVGPKVEDVKVGDIVVFHKAGHQKVEYSTLTRSEDYSEAGFLSIVGEMIHGIHSEAEAERLGLRVPELSQIEEDYGLDPIQEALQAT